MIGCQILPQDSSLREGDELTWFLVSYPTVTKQRILSSYMDSVQVVKFDQIESIQHLQVLAKTSLQS